MKISIIQKTFRIDDNPFLDSDIYIIYINPNEYGIHQQKFLDTILSLHIKDLKKIKINPIIIDNLDIINQYILQNNITNDILIDYDNPSITYPFSTKYIPSWCLIDWTDKIDMIEKWFLPEALRNHKVFKKYVDNNIRDEFNITPKKTINTKKISSTYNIQIEKDYDSIINQSQLKEIKKVGLNQWILSQLENTNYINDSKWFKPDTCPTTTIIDDSPQLANQFKTSKLSPYIALGVLSPYKTYLYWNGEDRMGSGRDQLLFREMFHACSQMESFWNDDFGKSFDWKQHPTQWQHFIDGNTNHPDLDWAINTLKRDGWIHHLARHLIADYLTRGKLEIHWKYGMEFFKQYLIDHDSCVNRGNWMWLSGTAFSTKQRSFYHYNYDNYLKNRNKKLKIKIPFNS